VADQEYLLEGLILSKLLKIRVTVPKERAFKDKGDVKAILTYAKLLHRC